MDYAKEIIMSVLLEEVQQNVLTNAIKRRHEVSFIYDSGDGDSRGKKERIVVQPVCYGLTKAGNPCFRAYQINGSSESAEKKDGVIPGWRLFLLDKVVSNTWKDSGKVFTKPPLYNENGDKTMAEVLVKADFTGAQNRYERGGLKKYNQNRHDVAVTKNPYYDFEKQTKNKVMAPDFVLKNIKDTEKLPYEREREWNLAMKGNEKSINDMSKQKDFGDDKQIPTSSPKIKGQGETVSQQTATNTNNYQYALQNGPQYKGRNKENNEEDKEDENGY